MSLEYMQAVRRNINNGLFYLTLGASAILAIPEISKYVADNKKSQSFVVFLPAQTINGVNYSPSSFDIFHLMKHLINRSDTCELEKLIQGN